MIRTFSHRGLERFFVQDDPSRLNPSQRERIRRILDRLDSAETVQDMNLPGYNLHRLTGNRRGTWSVTVSGNWRITFRFVNGHTFDVNLEDYH